MGCCCNKNPESALPVLKSKSSSVLAAYSSFDQSKLSKNFSDQVEKIKKLSVHYEALLKQSEKSSNSFKDSLENLELYLSEKKLEESEQVPEHLKCPNCLITYSSEFKPITLSCSHSLCEPCCQDQLKLKQSIKCSFECASLEKLEDLKTNEEVLKEVDLMNRAMLCFNHLAENEFYCVECQVLICKECCFDHPKHNVLLLSDPVIRQRQNIGKSKIENYKKLLEESLDDLRNFDKKFSDLKGKLDCSLNENVDLIQGNRQNFIRNLETATDLHVQTLKNCLVEILKVMPVKTLNLYNDSLLNELEKLSNLPGETDSKVLIMSKVRFNQDNQLSEPDFRPWEKIQSHITSMSDLQFLLLALTSLTIISS